MRKVCNDFALFVKLSGNNESIIDEANGRNFEAIAIVHVDPVIIDINNYTQYYSK